LLFHRQRKFFFQVSLEVDGCGNYSLTAQGNYKMSGGTPLSLMSSITGKMNEAASQVSQPISSVSLVCDATFSVSA
jgi:hypothetical protein